MEKIYYTYIVECADHSYYTGYTTDLAKRMLEHNASLKGAKYTKTRRPIELKYHETYNSLSEALKREYKLKRLTHQEKKKLIEEQLRISN